MFTLLYNTDTFWWITVFSPIEIFQPYVTREINQNKLENYLKETRYARSLPPNKH